MKQLGIVLCIFLCALIEIRGIMGMPTPIIRLDMENHLHVGDLVGYWEDNEENSLDVLKKFKHVMIFLTLQDNCIIAPPTQSKINFIHSSGARVIGRVGGYAMSRLWQNCSVEDFASQVVNIVQGTYLEGIDIQHEFDEENATFAMALYKVLKTSLPNTMLITLTPENRIFLQHDEYINLLQECEGSEFIEANFHNAEINSVSNNYLHNPYLEIVESMFGGDASKVGFGTCIIGCRNPDVPLDDSLATAVSCTIK